MIHARREREADREREPLALRARRVLDAGRGPQLRMALEAAVQLAERQQLVDGEESAFRQGRVPDRAGVALAEDESVPIGPGRILRIDAEDVEVESRDNVRRRHGAAGMATLGVVRHPDDVFPEGHGLLLEAVDELLGNVDHGLVFPRSWPETAGR